MLSKSKLNCIKTLMFQTFVDHEISHQEFITIVNEKKKYDQIRESIRNTRSKSESSENT